MEEEQQTYARKILEEAAQKGQKAGVEVRPHLLEGEQDVSELILSFLEGAGPVKFLVLGSHGHSFVSRHIIGSVTERVIREVATAACRSRSWWCRPPPPPRPRPRRKHAGRASVPAFI